MSNDKAQQEAIPAEESDENFTTPLYGNNPVQVIGETRNFKELRNLIPEDHWENISRNIGVGHGGLQLWEFIARYGEYCRHKAEGELSAEAAKEDHLRDIIARCVPYLDEVNDANVHDPSVGLYLDRHLIQLIEDIHALPACNIPEESEGQDSQIAIDFFHSHNTHLTRAQVVDLYIGFLQQSTKQITNE